jgi:hypothetical protein
MSGMFQRIARRHADRPDEPGKAATVGDDASVTQADAPTPDAATTVTPPAPAPAVEQPDEAPTERIGPLEAPPSPPQAADQPTTYRPASVPPPAPAAPASAQPVVPTPTPAPPVTTAPEAAVAEQRRPGFRARGRMRRRLRYLRKLRELQVRDLGGLVFDLRRFERKRDDLVAQKIDYIRACDDELRALEHALAERRELRDVREPGIGGTCPRCFAVFGSADRFCSNCGAALGGAVQGPAQVPVAQPPASDAQS